MPNYQNGKIYKIIDMENKVVYIGSTTEKLCQRFSKHKHRGNGNKIVLLEMYPCSCKEQLVKKEQDVIEQYGNLFNKIRAYNSEEYNNNYYINNKQLEKQKKYQEINRDKIKEHHKAYYQENKNKISEYYKGYREVHKEKISEKKKEYYNNNRDRISEKNKVKVLCECECEIRKSNITTHKKSQKHIKLMENITKQCK